MSEGGLSEYLEALKRGAVRATQMHLPGPNPYQGLRFFDERASILLTTREDTSSQIRKRFADEHCVFVIGGSGCGKSSLVRGKILDELRNFSRPIEGRDGDWETCSFRPETEPVEQFVDAFWNQIVARAYQPVERDRYDLDDPIDVAAHAQAEASRAEIRRTIGVGDDPQAAQAARDMIALDLSMSGTGTEKLHDGFASAYRWVDKINEIRTQGKRPAPANLMIIVDQFEELFRNRVDKDEAHALCAMIRHAYSAATRLDGVYVAISMRSEDVHRCAEVEGLADVVNSSVVLVDWLNRADLHKAIVDAPRTVLESWRVPVQRFGTGNAATAPYAPDVVEQIIDEVTWLAHSLEHKSDHLPLLQHGLHELWNIAAERWRAEQANGVLDCLSVELEDLVKLRKRCGLREDSFWLQAQLKYSARLCYSEARKAYNAEFPNTKPPVVASVALRAVLCEMASRDENGKIHRDFAIVSNVVRERLLPKDNDDEVGSQRDVVCQALQVALKVFADRQLLVELGSKSEPAYDVTHEALIRNWPQMRNWVDEDSELLDAYLNSVDDVDQRTAGQSVSYKIDKQYIPVLGPTCDWSWSRSIFRSPKLAKVWAWIWPGERQRYGESFSRRWLVRAIQERRIGRDESNGRASSVIPATEIVRGVRRRWRKDLLLNTTKKVAFAIGLFSVISLIVWLRVIDQKNDSLHEQRNSLISLMLVSNPAIARAPNYNKLTEIKRGLKPSFSSSADDDDDANKRIKFVAEIETIRNVLERLGSLAQATTTDLFSRQVESKNLSTGDAGFRYETSESRCVDVRNGSVITSSEFAIRIVRSSPQDGATIKFQASESDESPLVPISASTKNEIVGEGVRLPATVKRLCLSPDGRVAALTFKEVPVPRIYTLDVIRRFHRNKEGKHPVIGVAIMEFQASWYPEVKVEKTDSAYVVGFGSWEKSPTRAVYFNNETDPGAEPKFVVYFSDGLATPAPTGEYEVPAPNRLNWERTTEEPSLDCESRPKWKFGASPQDDANEYIVLREYISKYISTHEIGEAQVVISSNVWVPTQDNKAPISNKPSFIVFNVDLHHRLWDCKPLLLSSFVSSPTKDIQIESFPGPDGETALYLLDADLGTWRRISLLHGINRLADLVDGYLVKYDIGEYDQNDSAYSRLSAVFGITGSAPNDKKGQ